MRRRARTRAQMALPFGIGCMNRLANVVLGASLAALLYGTWRLLGSAALMVAAWTVVVVLAAVLAVVLLVALFVRFPAKANIAMLTASLVVSFAIGNWVLGRQGRDLIAIFDAKVAKPLAAANRPMTIGPVANAKAPTQDWESSKPVDRRDELQVGKDLAAAGIGYQQMGVSPLLLPVMDTSKGLPFFPLSMGANAVTVACNEGDQRDFPLWRTDRFGYNNDDAVYAHDNP